MNKASNNEKFNINIIKRKPTEESQSLEKATIIKKRNGDVLVKQGEFYSASGRHDRKALVKDGTNKTSRYDFIEGNHKIDISNYAVGKKEDMTLQIKNHRQVKNKEIDDEVKETKIDTDIIIKKTIKQEEPKVESDKEIAINPEKQVSFVKHDMPAKDDYSYTREYTPKQDEQVKKEDTEKQEKLVLPEINYQPKKEYTEEIKEKYIIPDAKILPVSEDTTEDDIEWINRKIVQINQVLLDFMVKAKVVDYIVGPSVTQFLVDFEPGVSVKKLLSVEQDIQRRLALSKGEQIRIIEQVPDTPYAGIQVPNKKRKTVMLGDIISSDEFKNAKMELPIAIGLDVQGNKVIADIVDFPHAIIAGTTKSGKSVQLHSIVLSLLFGQSPEDCRLILIDPKFVELKKYIGEPHLAMPVILDLKDFEAATYWLVDEMERRNELLGEYDVTNLKQYNKKRLSKGLSKLPYIVFIMDEFSNFFGDADSQTQANIQKLGAKARAAGIHMILATQHPSADVISGTIKANFDTRFAFRVNSSSASTIILGGGGAEKLLGFGDLLFRNSGAEPDRIQGSFIDPDGGDITRIVNQIKSSYPTNYLVDMEEVRNLKKQASVMSSQTNESTIDSEFADVARYCVANPSSMSKNSVKIKFGLGWPKVDRIFTLMEKKGIIGSTIHGKSAEPLISLEELEEILGEME